MDGLIEHELLESTAGRGTELVPMPLSVLTAWPEEREYSFKLRRVKPDFGARVYNIEADSRIFPFSDYQVVVLQGGATATVQKSNWKKLRHLHDAVHDDLDRLAAPHGWRETRLALQAAGMGEARAGELKSTDRAVAEFVTSAISRKHSVLGFDVDGGLFFAGIGVAMAAIVGPLVGPIIALCRLRAHHVESE